MAGRSWPTQNGLHIFFVVLAFFAFVCVYVEGGFCYFFVWLAFCFDFFFGESKREKEHDVGLVGI